MTIPLAVINITDARTIHPPHCRCGTKSKMSTKKASKVISRVGSSRMSKARRYRGECDGECRCAVAANMKQTSVKRAAIGWTISIEERECRVFDGREKSALSPGAPGATSISMGLVRIFFKTCGNNAFQTSHVQLSFQLPCSMTAQNNGETYRIQP